MTLHDLVNTIIIGFVLVTIILMFFMGATNAVFVALLVPISSFIAFIVIDAFGFSLNMMTLFSFLLALGIVVDDAIVVIENTHRIYDNGKVPIKKAAKILADQVQKGKLIHVFGTGGHSYIAGEEMFFRAGGLQSINAIKLTQGEGV